MRDTEKNTEKNIREHAKRLGGLALKLPALHYTGLPDRLVLLPGGLLFFAEIKSPGQKPKKIQKVVHEKLRGLGFDVHTIDNVNQLKEIFKQYVKRDEPTPLPTHGGRAYRK